MEKVIDLSKSVHELCSSYPEIKNIMRELGFEDITKPGMLNTAGRFMTVPKGAAMKGLNIELIKTAFESHGFRIQE